MQNDKRGFPSVSTLAAISEHHTPAKGYLLEEEEEDDEVILEEPFIERMLALKGPSHRHSRIKLQM